MAVERIGGWLIVRDRNGARHALRPSAVLAACELAGQDATALLPGGRTVVVPASLDLAIEAVRP